MDKLQVPEASKFPKNLREGKKARKGLLYTKAARLKGFEEGLHGKCRIDRRLLRCYVRDYGCPLTWGEIILR